MRYVILMLALMSSIAISAQTVTNDFVIDARKPYVFVEFDHAGSRAPLSKSESRNGLWFRIVNNCRIPIVVATFDPNTEDTGVGVLYDIIPVQSQSGYVSATGELHRTAQTSEVPRGYSLDVFAQTVVRPGDSLLFSIPSNHVQPMWYVQIKFRFDLSEASRAVQPFSLLNIVWSDIPSRYRKATAN